MDWGSVLIGFGRGGLAILVIVVGLAGQRGIC